MKTSNFVKSVEELSGLELKVKKINEDVIFIKNKFNSPVISIDVKELCSINTRFDGFRKLSDVDKIGLYSLCNNYVMSDVGDRESDVRYALEHKWLNYMDRTFLNYQENVGVVSLDVIKKSSKMEYLFTVEEWEKYTGRTIVELLKEFLFVNEYEFEEIFDDEIQWECGF